MYTFWRSEVCSCTFTFERKCWFQFKFQFGSLHSCVKQVTLSLESMWFSFSKTFSDFKESAFWLALSLRCKGTWSPLITGGSGWYLLIKYFTTVEMFLKWSFIRIIQSYFLIVYFIFGLQRLTLYSFIQSWIQCLINFSWSCSTTGSGCCFSH